MADDELKTLTVIPRYQEGTFMDAFILPAVRSLFISVLLAFIALVVSIRWIKLSFWDCVLAFSLTLLISCVVAFLLESKYWIWLIEAVMLKDYNGDGQIGPPEPKLPELPIRLITDDQHQSMFGMPYPEQAAQLARGLAGGETFSGRVWPGKDRTFSDSQWDVFTKTLRERGLATWKNISAPQQGMVLTPTGRAVFRELARVGRSDMQTIPAQEAERTYASDMDPSTPPWKGW